MPSMANDKKDPKTGQFDLKIPTPEVFRALVDAYVLDCTANKKPVLYSGLILAIGLASREAFNRYRGYGAAFEYEVNRARMIVQHSYEIQLASRGSAPAGPIFGLKQFGWSERPPPGEEEGATPDPVQVIINVVDASIK